ncbi:STAS domain-containing protein [Micromonospora sp. KLBMP9576]|uniref:STAS domain-containing protein n=1 Tax=Micromonospora sp. KLBMP9576 TaxID=3424769 RepID=UPI003D8C3764
MSHTRLVAEWPRMAPDDPIMSLALTSEGSAKRITVRGEIDMSNAHLLVELVQHVVGQRPARLALDLSGVAFFGAHGISALLQAQGAAADAGVPLALVRPAPCVAYILAVTGALGEFDLPAAGDGADLRRADDRRDGHRDALPAAPYGDPPLLLRRVGSAADAGAPTTRDAAPHQRVLDRIRRSTPLDVPQPVPSNTEVS